MKSSYVFSELSTFTDMRLPFALLVVHIQYICIESTPTSAERRLFNLLGPTTTITGWKRI